MRFIKFNLLILVYAFFLKFQGGYGASILEDKGIEVTQIKIPQAIWRLALRPTPVLKSPVTIVVPIHVAQEENGLDADEEDTVPENDVVEDAPVNDEVVQDEVVADPASPGAPADSPVGSPGLPQFPQLPQLPNLPNQPGDEDVNGQVSRFPCACVSRQCGCCTGSMLERFRTKACGNITFVPEDFIFDVRLSVNNNTVVRRRVSASDPPPICFNPRRAPFVEVCAEISNIRMRNRNAFACLDITANIAGFPVFSNSFRCFSFGGSGVQTGLKPRPVSSGPTPVNLFGNSANEEGGGFIEDATGALFGGNGDTILGGAAEGIFGGGGNEGGPLDAIGDAVGGFLDGRNID